MYKAHDSHISFRSTCKFFQIAYEGNFLSTTTFWQKNWFQVTLVRTRNYRVVNRIQNSTTKGNYRPAFSIKTCAWFPTHPISMSMFNWYANFILSWIYPNSIQINQNKYLIHGIRTTKIIGDSLFNEIFALILFWF